MTIQVFSDAFELKIWDSFFQNPDFQGVVLDTHHYLMTLDNTLFRKENAQVYGEYLKGLGKKNRAYGS